ncbi:MAG: DUF4365 domain-containing protein [Planctomicrobium sp.]|nr:DUF4365 domain-containing protein [Planctomicrobium sp.]
MKAQDTDRTERIGMGIAMSAFESQDFAFREQSESDYGIDAHAERIEGEKASGRLLAVQLKSGASYLSETCAEGYVYRTDKKHAEYWLNHSLPVLICLCDTDAKKVFWQVVTSDTAQSTGKGFKFVVPTSQQVELSSVSALRDLLSPVVAADRYTTFKTDDTSHGAAKRYSIEVVLNATMSKAEVAAIVRQVTNEGQKRRYHRNHLIERQWGDTDAHVVWTFIYPSAEDHKRRNHICRSIWINESLDPNFRPLGFDGENVGDNVIVDWSSNYDFLAELVATKTLSKEDWFAEVLPRIGELTSALNVIETHLLALSQGDIDEAAFITSTEGERKRIDEIYFELTDLPFAPFECNDVDEKVQSFVAYLHNIWLFYSENGRTKWDEKNRLEQALQQRSYARETLAHYEYELAKVR